MQFLSQRLLKLVEKLGTAEHLSLIRHLTNVRTLTQQPALGAAQSVSSKKFVEELSNFDGIRE